MCLLSAPLSLNQALIEQDDALVKYLQIAFLDQNIILLNNRQVRIFSVFIIMSLAITLSILLAENRNTKAVTRYVSYLPNINIVISRTPKIAISILF